MNHLAKIIGEFLKRDSLILLVLSAYVFALLSWLPTEDVALTKLYETGNDYYFKATLAEFLLNYLNSLENPLYARWLTHVIIPTATLAISYSVFRRFVGTRWATFLALLGLSFLDDYPFRLFLYDILVSTQPPSLAFKPHVITSVPFPSFTVLSALLAFGLCSVQRYIGFRRACVCSFSVAIVFYIHALTAGFLISFWLTYYFIRTWRQTNLIRQGFAAIGVQVFLFVLMISPGIVDADFSLTSDAENAVTLYFAIVYWFTPVLLVFAIHIVRRIDIREWLIKYMPIFVIMFLELLVILSDLLGLLAINFDFVYKGFSQFFLHALYFVPVINFLSRRNQGYSKGVEANVISKKIDVILSFLFGLCEKFVLPSLILVLLLYQNKWFLISVFH